MATLFIEPFGGIAGDMLLAALLDLKDPRFTLADLRELAASIVPGEVGLATSVRWHGSLSGTQLSVATPESGSPPHRRLADCEALLVRSMLAPEAQQRAVRVFRRIAQAEAHVHGCRVEEVHFHEVGAVDALIDVAGACFALQRLQVDQVLCSPPLIGSGTVRCAHGEMPVPAPGTAEILRGKPQLLGGGPGERTTPTGAALLVELCDAFAPPASFSADAIGYGAGEREFESGPPNLCRVQLGHVTHATGGIEAWLLEVNLDDQSAEEIGFLVQRLREAGALEVWSAGVQMKKDRPGTIVSALCRAGLRSALEELLFDHTPSLGCRWTRLERSELERESFQIELYGQTLRIKRRIRPGHPPSLLDLSAEHDDLVVLSRRLGLSLRDLEAAALDAALSVHVRESES